MKCSPSGQCPVMAAIKTAQLASIEGQTEANTGSIMASVYVAGFLDGLATVMFDMTEQELLVNHLMGHYPISPEMMAAISAHNVSRLIAIAQQVERDRERQN